VGDNDAEHRDDRLFTRVRDNDAEHRYDVRTVLEQGHDVSKVVAPIALGTGEPMLRDAPTQ
jgi:hypothetical protein